MHHRLTYANIVATLALFLALGGGSYAALRMLPANSVTSVQVRDGSLQARDFAAGQMASATRAALAADAPADWALVLPGSGGVAPTISSGHAYTAVRRLSAGIYCLTAPVMPLSRAAVVTTRPLGVPVAAVDLYDSPAASQTTDLRAYASPGTARAGCTVIETAVETFAGTVLSDGVAFSVYRPQRPAAACVPYARGGGHGTMTPYAIAPSDIACPVGRVP